MEDVTKDHQNTLRAADERAQRILTALLALTAVVLTAQWRSAGGGLQRQRYQYYRHIYQEVSVEPNVGLADQVTRRSTYGRLDTREELKNYVQGLRTELEKTGIVQLPGAWHFYRHQRSRSICRHWVRRVIAAAAVFSHADARTAISRLDEASAIERRVRRFREFGERLLSRLGCNTGTAFAAHTCALGYLVGEASNGVDPLFRSGSCPQLGYFSEYGNHFARPISWLASKFCCAAVLVVSCCLRIRRNVLVILSRGLLAMG